jgi:tRNA U34 5-carboxymethylaminomethyl modifying GTPase MnmE/TrmE
MGEKINDILNSWHDDDPSVVRSRRNHENIAAIADDVMSLKITLTTTNQDLIRAEERLEYLSKKVERLESVLNTTHSLATRVHLLEKQDIDFDEILKEMESLNTLTSIIKNFPLGIKGMILSIVAIVIMTAFITDISIRHQGYDFIKNYIIEETE